MSDKPVPLDLAQEVDRWVEGQLRDAQRYTNRTPLDYSGVWSLHRLIADAYSRGWADGSTVGEERARRARQRDEEATR